MSDTQIYQPKASQERSFGKYKVTRELGRGAMGVVYECFDPDFERAVAVKILSPDLMKHDTSGEYRQRFRNEMKAAGRLTHPNVISVFDAGEQEGVPFFVMEYVDGVELKEALDGGQRFLQAEVIKIMKEVLSGLKYIHAHNIIHRDLKPANIFLTKDGAAKITDFGIAKLESSELTRVGTIIGSPRYMSPEQCQGLPVDGRSDLFTAGIIFYQLLTNEHCFDSNSPTAIMQKIIHSEPDAPSVLIPTLKKAFDEVILRALQKDPESRYQSAQEFIEAIDQAVLGKVAKPIRKNKPGQRSPKVIASVAALLISVGAAAVFLLPKVIEPLFSPDISSVGVESSGQSDAKADLTEESDSGNNASASTNTLAEGQQNSTDEGNGAENDRAVSNNQRISEENPNSQLPVSNLSAENQNKLRRLLIVAEMHVLQGRLVAPSGSNAYDAYRIALEIDPNNQKAVEGIDRLESTLIDRINQLMREGNSDLAASKAKNGAQKFPDNQTLARLSESL